MRFEGDDPPSLGQKGGVIRSLGHAIPKVALAQSAGKE